jgi:CelD/BcsL family acetyltransferase involved in cellulose biosynthesis
MVAAVLGRKEASALQIDVLRPKELPASAMAAWRAMQRAGGGWDSPFLSPCWARSVELAKAGRDVRVAMLSEAGEPRAFMTAQVGKITALAAGGAMSDYEGLIGDPGPGFDVTQLVRALGVSRYDFSHVPAEQDAFARYARGGSVSWVIHVPDGYAAYAERRRADGVSALKEIDRKRRKLEREMGETRFTARSASKADFERLIELKRSQYRATGQTDVLNAGWTLKLLHDLFALDLPGFGGALFTLHVGEELAAVQLHLMGETTIHTWMVAHEDAFERYSPGLLLFQHILKWMDDQPFDRMDLGYGDYRFKRELSNLQRPLMHGFVGVPSAASFVRQAAYGVRRAAEALPLGAVSALPGKAMRRIDLIRGLR